MGLRLPGRRPRPRGRRTSRSPGASRPERAPSSPTSPTPPSPSCCSPDERLAGPVYGVHVVALLGALAAAGAAWLLATELVPARGAAAFWLVAASPAVANGYLLWAHSLSAALGGLAIAAAVRLARRGATPALVAGLAAALAAGALLRSEAVLFALVVAAALGPPPGPTPRPGRRRRHPPRALPAPPPWRCWSSDGGRPPSWAAASRPSGCGSPPRRRPTSAAGSPAPGTSCSAPTTPTPRRWCPSCSPSGWSWASGSSPCGSGGPDRRQDLVLIAVVVVGAVVGPDDPVPRRHRHRSVRGLAPGPAGRAAPAPAPG